ncbi:MAG: BrnA antitoxin family protein [Gammaproteobacteria bacterium]|nr:BrnA antitoxin family protein [Gammaproteobacteria bacterium]
MKKSYDFSKSIRNPYVKKSKKQLTIRLDEDTIEYFRSLSEDSGIPYQSLINLYLRECAASNKKLNMKWAT